LRALARGYKIIYYPNIFIYHPDKRNPNLDKVFKYSLGFGALLRKHIKRKNFCIIPYFMSYFGKSLIGIILYAFIDSYQFKKYRNRLLGTLRGFWDAKKIY